MKKIDILTPKAIMPKRETVKFLLNFSKSLEVIKTKNLQVAVMKN